MVAIFYNKKMLNDTLIINISNKKIISHIANDNFVIGYSNENEVSYINIFNFSKFMHLLDGYVRLDEKLCLKIKEITKIDLSAYIDSNNFVVGQIDECEKIEGTHLHKCLVNIGKEKLQIMCGASNARSSLKVVVALDGAMLPNGTCIRSGQILGNKSDLTNEREVFECINLIKENNSRVGISIKPDTPIEQIYKYLPYIHTCLVMTVEPGKGGQTLLSEMIKKISELKNYADENNLEIDIEADGGINLNTCEAVKEAGANILVAGTAILMAKDYKEIIKKKKK